jgi:hypothetical protein
VPSASDAAPVDESNGSRPAAHALTSLFAPAAARTGTSPVPRASVTSAAAAHPRGVSAPGTVPAPARSVAPASATASAEVQRLRTEVLRLELLVRKLQASLDAEKEYCAALEAHLKVLQKS